MEQALIEFLESYGYLALVAVGFAEYAGLPIAAVPVIAVAGALGAPAGLHPVLVVLSVAAGGLVADVGWYTALRRGGDRLVDAACGLTSNPDACVSSVGARVERLGYAYVVPSKFIPGAGNLVAAGAGLARMAPGRFVLSDGLALLLWAGTWTAAGSVFASQIRAVLGVVATYQRAALFVLIGLVVAAAVWRGMRVVAHRGHH